MVNQKMQKIKNITEMDKTTTLETYVAERLAYGKNKTDIVNELAYILRRHPSRVWIWLRKPQHLDPGLDILLKIWMSLSAKERAKYWTNIAPAAK